MGYNTSYLGRVDIVPGLNQAEYDYLRAFAASRRCQRRDGPYAVGEPDAYRRRSRAALDRQNQIATGQPSLWCHWEPCPYGCCLSWNSAEKFYAGGDWLRYLINHFLRPGAEAERSGDRQFEKFSFDHEVSGFIVGEQKDVRELFALIVSEGSVDRVVLREGDRGYDERGHVRDDQRARLDLIEERDQRYLDGPDWEPPGTDPWGVYEPYLVPDGAGSDARRRSPAGFVRPGRENDADIRVVPE